MKVSLEKKVVLLLQFLPLEKKKGNVQEVIAFLILDWLKKRREIQVVYPLSL